MISKIDFINFYKNIDISLIYNQHEACLININDKKILYTIAKLLPSNSTILEIGTYLGCSASILAHANPNLNIISVDKYDEISWSKHQPEHIKKVCGKDKKRSLECVQNYLSHFSNVTLLNKNSPYDFQKEGFEISLDVYIEDGTHNNPNFLDNINYWVPKIKNNGFVLLHDYRPKYPKNHLLKFKDVESQANLLLNNINFEYIMHDGHYIVFKKLKNGDEGS